MGWTGICIEAHPEYADQCVRNRPESICIHGACIGDDRKRVTFYTEREGLFSSLSSDDEGRAKRHYRHSLGHPFGGFKTVEVPGLTLDSALADVCRPIDLVSIDVEGSELDVLAGFGLEKHRPRVLLIEANCTPSARRLDRYLGRRGYCLAGWRRVNHFYCAKADRARLGWLIRGPR